MKKYILEYKCTQYFGLFETKRKYKTYVALDKNDLVETINKLIRKCYTFYIIDIREEKYE